MQRAVDTLQVGVLLTSDGKCLMYDAFRVLNATASTAGGAPVRGAAAACAAAVISPWDSMLRRTSLGSVASADSEAAAAEKRMPPVGGRRTWTAGAADASWG